MRGGIVTICDSGLSDVRIIHSTGAAQIAASTNARRKRGSVFRTLRGISGRAEDTVVAAIVGLR